MPMFHFCEGVYAHRLSIAWLFTFFQKAMFKKARTVFPFYKQLGWRPKTSEYRRAVGTIELVCGLILMLVPGKQSPV